MQNYNLKFKDEFKKRCINFSIAIIQLSDEMPSKKACWIIQDQLIRSATSIGANIVEARAASSRLEFKKFFEIALKSANESRYWLILIKEAHFVVDLKVDLLINEVSEIASILGSSVIKLKNIKF